MGVYSETRRGRWWADRLTGLEKIGWQAKAPRS